MIDSQFRFSKKSIFFILTVHCFLWTIHKIHCIVFFHVIHDNSFIFKSFQNKIFAGDFLLTSFTVFFFWCNMQIRYYSFSTFAQKWNNAYHKFDFKNSIQRQANQKRPILKLFSFLFIYFFFVFWFFFIDFFEVKVEFEKKNNNKCMEWNDSFVY